MKNQTQFIKQTLENLQLRGFEITSVGEYIFTNVHPKFPLCSAWEFMQVLKLDHAKEQMAKPMSYLDLKSLVHDVRKVTYNDPMPN